MGSTTSLIHQLKKDSERCPHITDLQFISGKTFGWNHVTQSITYDPAVSNVEAYLLHEYGHALLGHHDYSRDVTLLEMERAAWDQAVSLSGRYNIPIEFDLIETSLDSYRDWLHARATCPSCGATGVQSREKIYTCLACHEEWRVNDARACALRRYRTKKSR